MGGGAGKAMAGYRKLKDYWRERRGGRVQKVSLHAGLSCPNRDGTLGRGGCAYCSNEAFTPAYCHGGKSLREQLTAGLAFQRRRYPRAVAFLGYLQAYTNTHGNFDELLSIYRTVLSHPEMDGLVIGTRPDCLDDRLLDWLAEAAREKEIYVELGVESFSDASLRRMNRGHGLEASRRALDRLAERGLRAGAHFLVGFPGERWEAFFEQADALNQLPLHSIKVHQLHVFRDTPLAALYERDPAAFCFPEKQAYFAAAAEWLEEIRPELYIDRLFGDAPARFTIHPGWGIRMDHIVAEFDAYVEERGVVQGSLWNGIGPAGNR